MTPLKIRREDWLAVVNKLYDVEFDWLGIDESGNMGIFSSFNRGYVPQRVLKSYESYNKIFDFINEMPTISSAELVTMAKGNFNDWLSYARKGFFAFDFQDIHRNQKQYKYDLIAKPSNPVNFSSLEILENFSGSIPKFNLQFCQDIEFTEMTAQEVS